MSRPESVLMLARKFGEISASQENEFHKSRLSLSSGKENITKGVKQLSKSGPSTPVRQTPQTPATRPAVGGIASLRSDLQHFEYQGPYG
uniref:Uncharacterized protein n=1 Tax=Caenorhabditis japonica TaxID=281687 RepID=A0A8R1E9V1_CAEJA